MIATILGRAAPPAADRASAASATASSSDRTRGVPGTRLSPIASAPAATAAWMPAASVIPQIFTNGTRASEAGSVGSVPAATNARAAVGRIRGPDEGLADERGVEPLGAPVGDRRGLADARFGDEQPVVRDEPAEAGGALEVHVERAQVAVVQADEARATHEGALDLALVVRLDQRLHPQVAGQAHEAGQALGRGGGPPGAGRGRPRPRAAAATGARRRRTPWPGPER